MISNRASEALAGGSLIRKMFDEGARMRRELGSDRVYDFSLGNPDLPPPGLVASAIRELAFDPPPDLHFYMNNAGHEAVRSAIARRIARRTGLPVAASRVLMTSGAAAGLNAALRVLLDPGDEVLVLAPYFVEYPAYIRNHGGQPVIVPCDPETFLPDPGRIAAAMTPRTRVLLLNSPNNPSGVIYPAPVLESVRDALARRGEELGTRVTVLSDEPYADIVYDGRTVPETLSIFTDMILCTSYSKSLALPGERIGYAVVHPGAEDGDRLFAAMVQAHRSLGFVNAPATFQRVIQRVYDALDALPDGAAGEGAALVDVRRYEVRRNRLHGILTEAGFECRLPEGALYLFPRAMIADDVAFAMACTKEGILLVPGSGFGMPGFVRLAFCVDEGMIERSREAFLRVGRTFGTR